jgi:hypothetical protein
MNASKFVLDDPAGPLLAGEENARLSVILGMRVREILTSARRSRSRPRITWLQKTGRAITGMIFR